MYRCTDIYILYISLYIYICICYSLPWAACFGIITGGLLPPGDLAGGGWHRSHGGRGHGGHGLTKPWISVISVSWNWKNWEKQQLYTKKSSKTLDKHWIAISSLWVPRIPRRPFLGSHARCSQIWPTRVSCTGPATFWPTYSETSETVWNCSEYVPFHDTFPANFLGFGWRAKRMIPFLATTSVEGFYTTDCGDSIQCDSKWQVNSFCNRVCGGDARVLPWQSVIVLLCGLWP